MASQVNQINTTYISTHTERQVRTRAFNAIMRTYRHTLTTKASEEYATDYAYHLLYGSFGRFDGPITRQDLINAFNFNRYGYLDGCKQLDTEYLTLKNHYAAIREDYELSR